MQLNFRLDKMITFNAIIAFFGYNIDAYTLCRSQTSPNCNRSKTEYYHSTVFIWNKAGLEATSGSLVIEGVFISAILITSLLGNGALIATVVFEARFRTPTNFLVIGQCLGDLFLGLSVILLALIAAMQGGWKLSAPWCISQVFFNRFCLMLTFMNLALLAVDRYIVIVKTKHRNRFNTKQILLLFVLLWIASFLMSLPWDLLLFPAQIWFEVTNTFCLAKYVQPISRNLVVLIFVRLIVTAIIPTLVTMFCFYYIIGIVRTNRRKVGPSTVSNFRKIAVAVHAKSAYTSIAVLISFALCIIPFLLVFGLNIINKDVSYAVMAATKCMYYANTSIKPFIYISRNVPWSRKLRQIITRKRKARRVITNSPAAKRSSKYEIGDYRNQSNFTNTFSVKRTNSRKQLTSIDFHELFSASDVKHAWADNSRTPKKQRSATIS